MERTGECAHLAILAQGKTLYIDQVESPATLRVNVRGADGSFALHRARENLAGTWAEMNSPVFLEAFYTQNHHGSGSTAATPGDWCANKVLRWTTRSSIHVCVVSLSRFMIFSNQVVGAMGISGASQTWLTAEKFARTDCNGGGNRKGSL